MRTPITLGSVPTHEYTEKAEMELIPVIFFSEFSQISHRYRENLYRTNQLSFKALLYVSLCGESWCVVSYFGK